MSQPDIIINMSSTPKRKLLVTQPYLPTIDKYMMYVEKAFENKWLTNGGPLLEELTERLKSYLGVEHLLLVSSGTAALQIAYRIFNLNNKNVITTPFTFPATLTALAWQNANIKLADIRSNDWNLNPVEVEKQILAHKVDAIVPVNIFGAPCDLKAFDAISKKHGIPIIYDSAQALLSSYNGDNIFKYGDVHCVSFHATKLFHSVEGGAIIFKSEQDLKRAQRLINFGIGEKGKVYEPGINAKMSELHAAMGLCILDDLPMLVESRQRSIELYRRSLEGVVTFQSTDVTAEIAPMYMPIKFEKEIDLLNVMNLLELAGYSSRRYFFPDNHKFILNTSHSILPISNSVTDKILCLPLMHNLNKKHIAAISNIINRYFRADNYE